MTHASPSCLLIQLPIPARRELPVEGNIGCLSIRYVLIRYVLVFDIYHTAVPRDGISFIGYQERGQVRRLCPLMVRVGQWNGLSS